MADSEVDKDLVGISGSPGSSVGFRLDSCHRLELPLMTRHRWELLLPALFVAVSYHRLYMLIASHVVMSHLSTPKT